MKPLTFAAQRILITGANGQLGNAFRNLATSYPDAEFIFTEREDLDISNEAKVTEFFSRVKPTVCVNCAAYTAVDKAETERETCALINDTAVGYLAAAAAARQAAFIHISTDYVFNGKGTAPYNPADDTDPVNFYGATKLAGEKKALQAHPGAMIIRTAWVYSNHGNNFLKTMVRLMQQRDSIGVVSDQQGTPTFAPDLAQAILRIIFSQKISSGIFHYTNQGETTWFGFATEIARLLESSCVVKPLSTAEYPTPAARPGYSVLNTEKIRLDCDIAIPEWKASVRKCLNESKAQT